MEGWITGSEAVKKVSLLKSALERSREKKLSYLYGDKRPRFHPIYSSLKYTSAYTLSLVEEIEKTKRGRLWLLDEYYLDLLHELYTKSAELNLLAPQKPTYSIYTTIIKELPEAKNEFEQAFFLVKNFGGWIGEMGESILHEIVPLKGRDGDSRPEVGFSDYNLLGSIFTGMYRGPFSDIKLAIAFAHEIGHQVLMFQQAGETPITEDSFSKWIYSGVRKTKRPSIAAFHAVVALAYMNEMYKSLLQKYHFNNSKEKFYVENKFEENNASLVAGLDAVSGIELTQLGDRIIADIRSTLG